MAADVGGEDDFFFLDVSSHLNQDPQQASLITLTGDYSGSQIAHISLLISAAITEMKLQAICHFNAAITSKRTGGNIMKYEGQAAKFVLESNL